MSREDLDAAVKKFWDEKKKLGAKPSKKDVDELREKIAREFEEVGFVRNVVRPMEVH